MFATSKPTVENNFTQEMSFARLSERNGDNVKAKKLYRHILSEEPENRIALHRMGVISGKEGQYDEAVKYLTHATTVGDPSAELLSDLGYVYYLQHNQDLAKTTLERALAEDPDYEAARTNLAIVYAELGQYDIALNHFRQVSSEAEALSNLAYIQSQRGDLELAQRNYSRALDIDKRLRPAAEALIQIAQMTGDVTDRPNVRPHVVPTPEQPKQEMVAQANQSIPAASQFVAKPAPESATNNPLRAASQSDVQQVQYSSTSQQTKATSGNAALTIPTQSLGASPAVFQISDEPASSSVQQPPRASTQIGAMQSASAQSFNQQIMNALQAASTK
ncbi:photosystem I assembly protein Ycf3 [Bremerella volcania]|uniref:Photosystem I assembly protein Ycf3 n=1 Tax=Bremerella volcania TaxID=2527984 RepID=A0A518CBG0_9BACT|nr:tetratricopeptide repeat protein [Bremerella volcania]QDU76565.1 photosystem I assembly protein Ycf3 [Bremerella volcania]